MKILQMIAVELQQNYNEVGLEVQSFERLEKELKWKVKLGETDVAERGCSRILHGVAPNKVQY